jgi:EAL domain-containing protein (putative c-di-GMP-specific phosphodiesterase class I)
MGCLTAQGYLFSAAVPMAKVTDLLVNQQAA